MRIALLLLLAVVAGCGGDDADDTEPTQGSETSLGVAYRPQGPDHLVLRLRVVCGPSGRSSEELCRRLDALEDDAFDPVPADVACAEIYGGPQTAEVTGTFRGRPVDARFNRTNACEMERFDRVRFLFPTASP